jgi:hypothetical protein
MLNDWKAESLRLTFFVQPQWVQRQLFGDVLGIPATEVVARPQLQYHQEVGAALGGQVSIIQQPQRVDFILSEAVTARADARPFFWIGQLTDSLEEFDRLVEKAVPLIKTPLRVAFAIAAIQESASAAEAMRILRKDLPTVAFDEDNDLDLAFQINRPRRGFHGERINRVSKWETIESTRIQFVAALPPTITASSSPGGFAARVYVDANTEANTVTPIANDDLTDIIRLIRSMAIEIIEKGDVK